MRAIVEKEHVNFVFNEQSTDLSVGPITKNETLRDPVKQTMPFTDFPPGRTNKDRWRQKAFTFSPEIRRQNLSD